MLFSPQMPLPLEPRRHARFDNFVAGPNRAALDAVQRLRDEPGLFLSGPEGSGKTHLLTALCHATRDAGRTAFYAGLKALPADAHRMLDGLEELDLLCVDDLQLVAGNAAWERALFHAFNRMRDARGQWVVASRVGVSALPLELPDLVSRLAWGVRVRLKPLAEADKLQVLCQQAASLGIELPGDVQNYLIKHGDRSLKGLLHALDRMQHAAFTAKRRITVPLAREVLAQN